MLSLVWKNKLPENFILHKNFFSRSVVLIFLEGASRSPENCLADLKRTADPSLRTTVIQEGRHQSLWYISIQLGFLNCRHWASQIHVRVNDLRHGETNTCTNQSCKQALFWRPNPAWARHLYLKPDLCPKTTFTELVKIRATVGCQKTQCTGIAAGTLFYHAQNSNHLDQNIGLNTHKLSLLVNCDYAPYNVSQEKEKRSMMTL